MVKETFGEKIKKIWFWIKTHSRLVLEVVSAVIILVGGFLGALFFSNLKSRKDEKKKKEIINKGNNIKEKIKEDIKHNEEVINTFNNHLNELNDLRSGKRRKT